MEVLTVKVFCGIDWAEGHHDIALVDELGDWSRRNAAARPWPGFAELMAIVVGGLSPATRRRRALIEPLLEAGVTWWDERQLITSADLYRLGPVSRRLGQGPPAL
jgi:hypothetical protein